MMFITMKLLTSMFHAYARRVFAGCLQVYSQELLVMESSIISGMLRQT